MESLKNRRCPCVSVTAGDNPSKFILDVNCSLPTIKQTSEERIVIVKTTTHHGIYCQDSRPICQILSNILPEIMSCGVTVVLWSK